MSLTKWTGHKCVLTSIIDAWLIAKLNINGDACFLGTALWLNFLFFWKYYSKYNIKNIE